MGIPKKSKNMAEDGDLTISPAKIEILTRKIVIWPPKIWWLDQNGDLTSEK